MTRAVRPRGMAWFRGRGPKPRIRVRDAVPVRRDRRDLRRQFRRAARDAVAERKAETTAVLRRLSAGRVLLSGVTPGSQGTEEILEFVDGTRLLLKVRCGRAGMERLEREAPHLTAWIAQVQPCFGRRRSWLWFFITGHVAPVELLASVVSVPPSGHPGGSVITI